MEVEDLLNQSTCPCCGNVGINHGSYWRCDLCQDTWTEEDIAIFPEDYDDRSDEEIRGEKE